MIFIFDITRTVLKMVCVRLTVRVHRHTKFFRYITAYGEGEFLKAGILISGWKCIFNCVSWFLYIILYLNALSYVHAFQRHYTVLFKNNRIFCLKLGIIFGKYFLNICDFILSTS